MSQKKFSIAMISKFDQNILISDYLNESLVNSHASRLETMNIYNKNCDVNLHHRETNSFPLHLPPLYVHKS